MTTTMTTTYTRKTHPDEFKFLDNLRASGKINMFGAPPYLAKKFGFDIRTSKAVFLAWAATFDKE